MDQEEKPNTRRGRTQACNLPLLLLLLWVFAGSRGRRLEVEGWGDGIIHMQSVQIRCPKENARAVFSIFSIQWPGFQKVCLPDPCGPKRCKTCAFIHISISMWMAPKFALSCWRLWTFLGWLSWQCHVKSETVYFEWQTKVMAPLFYRGLRGFVPHTQTHPVLGIPDCSDSSGPWIYSRVM